MLIINTTQTGRKGCAIAEKQNLGALKGQQSLDSKPNWYKTYSTLIKYLE